MFARSSKGLIREAKDGFGIDEISNPIHNTKYHIGEFVTVTCESRDLLPRLLNRRCPGQLSSSRPFERASHPAFRGRKVPSSAQALPPEERQRSSNQPANLSSLMLPAANSSI